MKKGNRTPARCLRLGFVLSVILGTMLAHPVPVPAQTAGFTTLDYPAATVTTAIGINPQGGVVGHYTDANSACPHLHAFELKTGTYTSFDFPGATLTSARGISPQGDIVGFYSLSGGCVGTSGGPIPCPQCRGFLLSAGNFRTIRFPGATFTRALGINPEGAVVGDYKDNGGKRHGFLLKDGNYTTLDPAGATYTEAHAINPQGDIVGQYTDSSAHDHGFLLRHGSYTRLDFPGAPRTLARGINPENEIVGAYDDSSGHSHGFVLSDSGYTTLDARFPGVTVTDTDLFGINPRGGMVGDYSDSAGRTHGLFVR